MFGTPPLTSRVSFRRWTRFWGLFFVLKTLRARTQLDSFRDRELHQHRNSDTKHERFANKASRLWNGVFCDNTVLWTNLHTSAIFSFVGQLEANRKLLPKSRINSPARRKIIEHNVMRNTPNNNLTILTSSRRVWISGHHFFGSAHPHRFADPSRRRRFPFHVCFGFPHPGERPCFGRKVVCWV